MIAIKDMEIPKCCSECELKSGSYCYHKKPPYDLNSIDVLKERASDCLMVEIVTCKDCKHWHDDGIMTTCDKNIGHGFPKDYFCAESEGKE